MSDLSPEKLLAQYSEAKQELTKARADFLEQLKAKGIDTRFIIEERKDKFLDSWESVENSWRLHDPPHTVVWIDQTEFADYWSAKSRFESVQTDCREMMKGLWPQYEEWQQGWDKHFHKQYGIHPASGIGPELDAKKAAEFKADLDRKRQEHEEWKAKLCAPKVPVPSGWEGERPEWEIESLEDLESYLTGILGPLREFGLDESYGPFNKRFIEAGREAIRNAYRILRQLEIFNRPPQSTDLDEPFKVESALDELLAWIGRSLSPNDTFESSTNINNETPTIDHPLTETQFKQLPDEERARYSHPKSPSEWLSKLKFPKSLRTLVPQIKSSFPLETDFSQIE